MTYEPIPADATHFVHHGFDIQIRRRRSRFGITIIWPDKSGSVKADCTVTTLTEAQRVAARIIQSLIPPDKVTRSEASHGR